MNKKRFQYISTSIENYVPTAKFDLNANSLNAINDLSTAQISLSNVRLESNASYWMQFSRNPVRYDSF